MMRRCLALTLSLMLALAAWGGAAGAAGDAALYEERKTLSFLFAEPTTLEDVNTNYATQYLSDKLNVDMVFHFLPSSEWATKLDIMVSANEKLPDIVFGTSNDMMVAKYGASGVYVDLMPYYEEHSIYIKEQFEKNDMYRKLCTFADGKMYSVGRLQEQSHTDYGNKFFINQQWLSNLGLEMPTTTDELLAVLRAFRDDDPNQNGQADEIPMTGSMVAMSYNPMFFLMGSFTFVNTRHLLQVNDGKLNLAYTTDGWRDGLRYLKGLYDEGLIDPLLFTQDLNQYKAVIQKEGDTIVGSLELMNTSTFDKNPKMLEYTGVSPFIGPDGTQYAPYQTFTITYNGSVTRDCADPVTAFRFLDALWELDNSMVIRYGEEGVDWEWVPEGTKSQFESSGYPATFRLLSTAQTGVQNKWWNVWSPMYLPYEIGNGWADDDDPLNIFRIAYDTVGKLQGYIPDEVVGKITYTIAESEQISEILSNLNTAYAEWMTLFVIGDRNIEAEWDAYLAELEKIGIAEYLEVAQIAYDRTYDK